MRPLATRWLGRVRYAEALALQESLRRRILEGDESAETLLLLEHEPVITLGRGADPAHLKAAPAALAARGVELVQSSRGGDVTWHGPGQLVAYPVLRLQGGIVRHVETLAAAVIRVAASHGVRAEFRRDCPGVWIADAGDPACGGRGRKLAAFGIHVHRRVAIHGAAFNIASALDGFSLIVPCGQPDATPTSLSVESGKFMEVSDVIESFAEAFCAAAGRARSPLLSASPTVE